MLAICRYHRNSNGWNDIGYNFVVDRYGTIYEGRAGGLDQAVIGAQAQGYNAQSTGIATLGTHSSVPLTAETMASIASIIRWKLPLHAQPTTGEVLITSAGGSSNRYPSGTEVTFQRVSGHRDADSTSCPARRRTRSCRRSAHGWATWPSAGRAPRSPHPPLPRWCPTRAP